MAEADMRLPDSLWAATAAPAAETPPLSGRHEADVVVVGGGFAGLSTALHLSDAGKRVILIEAGEPGWGASGRNGGQVNPAWRMLPSEIRAKYGSNRAPAVLDMLNRSCDLLFDLVERHKIDCDAMRPGFVHAGFGSTGKEFLDGWIREWGELGVPVERLDRKDVHELIGTKAYHLGMRDPRGGHVQPLSYARGLARAAISLGASIHGRTRAETIRETGRGWTVVTDGGEVEAEHVVLCTNAYTDALWPNLRKAVVPVTSFLVASEPLDAGRLATILPGRHAVAETRRALHYYRLDRDNRFVMGGRGNLTNVETTGSVEHLKATALELYPELEGVRWEYSWGGRIAVTPDHTPRLFRLARNVHAALAFNGRGVAMGTMFGLQATRAVLGEEPDMPVEPIGLIPNHALRQFGITWHLVTGGILDRRDIAADPASLA